MCVCVGGGEGMCRHRCELVRVKHAQGNSSAGRRVVDDAVSQCLWHVAPAG